MNRWIALALIIFQLGATTMANNQAEEPSLIVEGVSRELARRRASIISDVRYRLRLELAAGASRVSSRMRGREEIRLKLANTRDDVILDFRDLDPQGKSIEGAISNVKVNGQMVKDSSQTGGHIIFPARHFHTGENTIALDFETGVAAANRPIIRYKDADDGNEYIYTLLVPMDASLAFPCFDQPDLKARFTLSVSTPEDWTAISNTEIEKSSPTLTEFKETHPISTYLFAFAAGPFKKLEGDGASAPMRLFVRQSKLARAQEEWPETMKLTREGMAHFVNFFHQPFPFTKYDQVLIPGFAYGGMEHAGATFLREDAILFRSTPTRNDKLGRASLVLHELAHQWFGDLVTMRWFDDLWLKEAGLLQSRFCAEILDK